MRGRAVLSIAMMVWAVVPGPTEGTWVCPPALAAPQTYLANESEKIKAAIESAHLVPAYYRHHINITTTSDAAAIAVFRDPDAQPYDCQIDAILMAQKVRQAVPEIKRVVVAFYQLFDAGNFWQVTVPISAVGAFADGAMSREEVIRVARLAPCKANALSREYAPLSYRDITKEFGIVNGPLRHQRAYARVRVSSLEQKGIYAGDLRRQFLHVEDSARRGETEKMRELLQALSIDIERRLPAQERRYP